MMAVAIVDVNSVLRGLDAEIGVLHLGGEFGDVLR